MDGGSLLDALLFGDAEKIAIIDPERFPSKKGEVPAGWTNPAIREARDDARAAGRIPILKAEFSEAQELARALAERLAARDVTFDEGDSQVTLDWIDPVHGTPCRGTLDHLVVSDYAAIITDLKRKEDCSPESLARAWYDYGYDIQRTAYVQAVEQLYPHLAGRVRFRFIFAEVTEGELVDVVVAEPAGSFRAIGEARWRRACRIWSECLASGRWPGYSDDVIQIEARPWQLASVAEEIAEGIVFA